MLRQIYMLAFGFFIALLMALPLAAADHCATRAVLVQRLAAHYGETRQAVRVTGDSVMLEIFASPATGSWTIVRTARDGPSCLVAAGRGFDRLRRAMPQQDLLA